MVRDDSLDLMRRGLMQRVSDGCSFITITLKPKLYQYSSITQLEITNGEIYRYLYRCSEEFYCVAEHTKAGNVHYHAIVRFMDGYRKMLLINSLKKSRMIGFVKFDDNIIDREACVNYLIKDYNTNMRVFNSSLGHKPYFTMCHIGYRNIYDI